MLLWFIIHTIDIIHEKDTQMAKGMTYLPFNYLCNIQDSSEDIWAYSEYLVLSHGL